jgi:N-acetylglucosamine kinase-like BadF-type ATPase
MSLYLALDAGGTKTDYVLADDTRELARVRSGTIKRMRTDAATAAANLDGALAQLTAQTGISLREIHRTCIGTAGESVPLVADWLRTAFQQRVPGELILIGDVEIALDAAFPGAPGVLVMAGTGSNVAGRGRDGKLLTSGGWGPALADQGSGHRIGLHGLQAAFLAIDEGRSTALMQAILHAWQLRSIEALIEYGNALPPPDFSTLAQVVVACAEQGDTLAAEVLLHEGEALGYLVRLLLRRLTGPGERLPQIAFTGSILENVAPVRDALIHAIAAEFPSIQCLTGVVDPLQGALWRARNPL